MLQGLPLSLPVLRLLPALVLVLVRSVHPRSDEIVDDPEDDDIDELMREYNACKAELASQDNFERH